MIRSPERHHRGRARARPAHPTGSLGIAISEAVEVAAATPSTNYALGSVLNHVCLHQTVIGQEAIAQMEMAGEEPDVVVGCVGGGSNFAGLAFPFVRRVLRGEAKTRFLAAEPAACPTLTRGAYRYDFGDTVGLTPLMPMYTLGHDFVPPPVHAGGLRYHGDSPMVCGLVQARPRRGARLQAERDLRGRAPVRAHRGDLPAPEPAHAIRAVFEEAEAAKQAGEERVILLGLSGHGHFDMSAYQAYLAGELEDPEFSEADMEAALERLPDAPGDRLDRAPRPALALASRRLREAGRSGTGSGSGGVGSSSRLLGFARHRNDAAPLRRRRPRLGLPLSQAGPRPPGQLPRKSAPSAPSQNAWIDRRAAELSRGTRSARPRSRRGPP